MSLLQVFFTGLSVSAIYAIMALGFVVIFKGTKVMNLAQGSVMLVGVYVIFLLGPALGFYASSAVGIGVGILLSVLIQYVIAAAKTEDHLVMVIITIGADIVISAELAREIGDNYLFTGDPWGDTLIPIGDAQLPLARLAALIISVVLISVFFAVFRFTPFGVKMRAAASDAETSALMGISQRRVAVWSWAIGGGLAVTSGVFLAAFPGSGLGAHSGAMAMAVIPAIIIGGMDSFEGAIIGAVIVGYSEAISRVVIANYVPWLNDGFAGVVPYILMLIILLVKPSGLFGTKVINRV
jgi:branched-chain amino acid transport system permease protein